MDELKPKLPSEQAQEELEIIELDDRLDLAFDPLSIVGPEENFISNGNCGNGVCCPKSPVI
jgi:hypothetical protein